MKRHIIMLVAALALSSAAIGMRSYASPAQHGAAIEPQAQGKPMGEMRKMMEQMHASDAELQHLVADMNASTGDAKVAAMAALLTRMVQRQTTMRQEMQESMKTMMAQCPMVKDAGAHEHKP
jgi:hypothetical protein